MIDSEHKYYNNSYTSQSYFRLYIIFLITKLFSQSSKCTVEPYKCQEQILHFAQCLQMKYKLWEALTM